MAKLVALQRLQEGWSGAGSRPIHPDVISAYSTFVEPFGVHVPLDLEPIALEDGGIALEWDRDEFHFEVEIRANGSLYLCRLGATEDDDDDRTYENFDAESLKEFYETGSLGE